MHCKIVLILKYQAYENLRRNPLEVTHEPIMRIISKQLDKKLGTFTLELDSVLRKMKNRKAAGLDEIPPEVWKTRQFDDILFQHCNAVYNQHATTLFVDFMKAFDSIHRGKMEQILLTYGLPKETVTAIMMLYRNTKAKFYSPDGDSDYFDIVADVQQGDT